MADSEEDIMPKLSLDELRKEPAFLALSERYQSLVLAFLQAKEDRKPNPKVAAIQAVCNPKSIETARVVAYQYFAKAAIVDAVQLGSGLSSRQRFEMDLQRAISN